MVPIFCYAKGIILLFLTVLAHAHLVSSDYPMSSHNCDLPLESHGHATIEDHDYVFRLTGYPHPNDPDRASYVGQVRNPKLIKLYYRTINQVNDLTTMYSNYSIFGDDFVFFVASADFLFENQDGLGILLLSKYGSKNNNLNVSATGYRLSEGKQPHNYSQTRVYEKKRNLIKIKLWEGLAVGCLCLSMDLLAMLICFLRKKNKGKEEELNSETVSDQNMDEEFQMDAGPKKISYQELLDATNNFEETLKLGEGGFGGVYKGYFKNTNSVAAIKRRKSTDSWRGIKQYSAEVKIISQFRHKYLVKLKYSSENNNLNVSATGYGLSEGQEPHNVSQTNLREHLPKNVGIYTSSGKVDENKRNLIKIKLWEGLAVGCLCLSLGLLATLIYFLWKKNKGKKEEPNSETVSDQNMDEEFQMGAGPKKINYQEVLDATNNFEATLKLGEGGFGGVYKGYFKDTNSVAAIKRRISADSWQGIKQYSTEVKIISQLRHRNLVKLNGWCHKKKELILIYEYMPNGSLDFHLFRGQSMLSWHLRFNIALGLASALLYLQEELEKCVIHRDIKSSNIMLDSNFNTKLGDFGLARLMDHEKESETTIVAGTRGYLAPEYLDTGKARKESDIFSFGVVLLEIACGKKAIHHQELKGEVSLVEWVWELYGLRNIIAAADPKLYGQFDVKELECLLVVGLWCANPDSTSRPSIKTVIKALNFEAPLPILPQNMPFLDPLSPPIINEQFFSVPSSFREKG